MKLFHKVSFFFCLSLSLAQAQGGDSLATPTAESAPVVIEESKERNDWFKFNGYLKYMQTVSFNGDTTAMVDNLIHNRMNFAAYLPKGHKFVAQFRNRIFYGNSVSSIDDYGDVVSEYDGTLPLEWVVVDNESVAMTIIADRLYYDYTSDKFQVTIGRQRINWGINTTWNPNDIFNSYNIYDFDYEEREGSDAIRVKIFPNYLSSFDAAYKFTDNFKTDVAALLYKFNKMNYDFQFLAGKFEEKIAIGAGWAGSIKTIGFKGELTYFEPYTTGQSGNLSASTALDYSWENGLYFMATYLYNGLGADQAIDPFVEVTQVPNAENLMPAKHNAMMSSSYTFSPIFSANVSAIYSFEINSATLFPTLTFSLKSNLDLDLIGQFFFQETPQEDFTNLGNGVFGRLKWSF